MVKVKNLNLLFSNLEKEEKTIKKISFSAKKGTISALVGESRCGKTTVLRCLAGIELGYEGSIIIDDQEVKTLDALQITKLVGFVYQNFNLFPHLTVIDNCVQPLVLVQKLSLEEAKEKALKALDILNLLDMAKSYPTELTTDQQQKVAIAKALCSEPKLILLDEPTSAISRECLPELNTTLQKLCKKGVTIIFTSPDASFLDLIPIKAVHLIEDGQIAKTTNSKQNEKS